ncbi:anti-sigma factor [Actinophytocola gossypii]|uniref:Zf-HC2 domain-containing protein n=1 Tax=Actinophytocola gossypii TaxID=2812003 RepID=A0ABT2J765_9PSEU|nr:zf-HC2 domain-containing protein [Actinophytocola gossypii]MCT2583638.1 zf-HC2 domain-containing protein [Actinophytocola gossypii]
MSSVEHDRSLLGAYALGSLDPGEERAVHAHVSTCPECQRELAEFVDLRHALDQVPPEAFLDGPPDGGDLLLRGALNRVRAEAAPARRGWSPGLVAASVVLAAAVALGGGVLIGRETAPTPPAEALPAGTVTAEGTDPATGATMRVEVEPRAGWVWVNAEVEGVPAGERCELLVVPEDGEPLVAGSWVVSDEAGAEGLRLEGTALVEPGEVESVEIVTTDGRRMVSVPI